MSKRLWQVRSIRSNADVCLDVDASNVPAIIEKNPAVFSNKLGQKVALPLLQFGPTTSSFSYPAFKCRQDSVRREFAILAAPSLSTVRLLPRVTANLDIVTIRVVEIEAPRNLMVNR